VTQAAAVVRAVIAQAKRRGFTLEAIASGHIPELTFMRDHARWILAMCSRRAGKTYGIAGRYAKRSMLSPGSNRIYLALTGGQARDIMWEPIWKPLCAHWNLPVDHNETRMVTTFANGSRVRLAGTDDITAIKKELGAGLDEACVDEGQDQKDNVLRDLCVRILPPALTDKFGTLIVCGVVPEVAAGYFWELWATSNWSKHNWSQMDNPHMPRAMDELREYLAKNPGLTIDSPVIQRERFGKFTFDKQATAYRYAPDLNGYAAGAPPWLMGLLTGAVPDYLRKALKASKLESLPERHLTEPARGGERAGVMASAPHPGIVNFSAAVDPGTSDRASVSVIGWGEDTEEVQHVFEWSSPRKAGTTLGQLAVWMAVAQHEFRCDTWHWDPGSGKMELDTFASDYGLPVIRAALKTETAAQIRRVNDLLTRGLFRVMAGSAAAEDMMRARRDPNSPASGQWRWASQWHPDPSESLRYALQGYWASYEEPQTPPTPDEARAERIALATRQHAPKTPGDEETTTWGDEDGGWSEEEPW
jgi:hypothetical protein